jgi:hypothetical protein
MQLLNTPGLKCSLLGGVVFFFGLIALLFLPLAISIIAMIAGGLAVWGGFIWTLFSYYTSSSEFPPIDTEQ